MSLDHDAVVVGSGFGGAAVALRLAQAGYDVLVLERGRRWQPEGFGQQRPDATFYPRAKDDPWLYDPEEPQENSGWVEVRRFRRMWVVAGAGVGGGSLHFSNVAVPPASVSFEVGWPRPFRDDPDLLAPHVERVGSTLGVEKLPDGQRTARTRLVEEAAQAAGVGERLQRLDLTVRFDPDWAPERADGEDPRQAKFSKVSTNEHGVEVGTCVHLGNCNIGCDVHARKTLDTNYLPGAEAAGAEIRPLHHVRRIEPISGGYRVSFDRIEPDESGLVPGNVTARIVVLAAGSLGSTELLLRCRDEFGTLPDVSEHLGRDWSPNGDFFTPALYDRDLRLTQGPPITEAVDFVDTPGAGGERFYVQDVGFPDVLGHWLAERAFDPGGGLEGTLLRYAAQRILEVQTGTGGGGLFDRLMMWFAEGQDAADGRLRLRRRFLGLFGSRDLYLDWDAKGSASTLGAIETVQQQLTDATGGRPLPNLDPSLWMATFHPLGGCNMADPPGEGITYTDSHGRTRRSDHGVVDHRGEVFGHPNLFVADGAVIPEPVGRNPSRTIAAVAERVAALIVQEGR